MDKNWIARAGALALILSAATTLAIVSGCGPHKNMYTARTTLMEGGLMTKEGAGVSPSAAQTRMQELAQLATSQRVLVRASRTLANLRVTISPKDLRRCTTAQVVKDTNMLAIEVTLERPEEAKVAADVVASELKKAYGRTPGPSLKTVDVAHVFPAR